MNWKEARQTLKSQLKDIRSVVREKWDPLPLAVNDDLLALLRDRRPSARHSAVAVVSLIAIHDSSSHTLDPLVQSLRDSSPDVRSIAATTLGAFAHAPAIPGLIALLQSSDPEERETAGFSLVAIGQPSVRPLVRVLTNKVLPSTARTEAASALFNMGPDVVDWLLPLFREPSDDWQYIIPCLALFPQSLLKLNQMARDSSDIKLRKRAFYAYDDIQTRRSRR